MRLNHLLCLVAVAAAVIALDQATKVAAFNLDGPATLLGGFIELDQVENTGAAFGILRDVPGSAVILTVTTMATIVLLAAVFRALIRTHLWGGRVALGLIYGGAIGNLGDRVALGHVRDFIKLDLTWLRKGLIWPAFNIADVMIVIGIILLLLGLASMPRHPHAAAHAAPKTTNDAPPARPTAPATPPAPAEDKEG